MTRARAIIQASNAVLLLIVRLRAAMGPAMGKRSLVAQQIAVIIIAAMAVAMPRRTPAIALAIVRQVVVTDIAWVVKFVMAVSLIAEHVRLLQIKDFQLLDPINYF